MNIIEIQYYTTPLGELILGAYQGALCLCDWRYRAMRTAVDNRLTKGLQAEFCERESEIVQTTCAQLKEYFAGTRQEFTVPVRFVGTEFQQRVWQELVRVPYGKTYSYLQLSEKLGNADAIRAVAAANGANAIAIIVPCHRIVGTNGELTGYAGGLPAKQKLLALEKVRLFSESASQTVLNF